MFLTWCSAGTEEGRNSGVANAVDNTVRQLSAVCINCSSTVSKSSQSRLSLF